MARQWCLAIGFVLLAFGIGKALGIGDPIIPPSWYQCEDSFAYTEEICYFGFDWPLLSTAFGIFGVGVSGVAVAFAQAGRLSSARRRTRLVARFGRGSADLLKAPAIGVVDSALARVAFEAKAAPHAAFVLLDNRINEQLSDLESLERRSNRRLLLLAGAAAAIGALGIGAILTDAFTGIYAAESTSLVVIARDAVVSLRIAVATGAVGSGLVAVWIGLRDDTRELIDESSVVTRRALADFVNQSVRQ